uniref:Uncharacterized protein n=1 Tax=Anguilla anguilla TaxID=7936 RepID=A0A0E9UP37_ANGAN
MSYSQWLELVFLSLQSLFVFWLLCEQTLKTHGTTDTQDRRLISFGSILL